MDRTIILLAIFVLLGVSAFAQQDSLIVGNVYIDSGTTGVFVPVYGVTNENVTNYNFILEIIAPDGNAHITSEIQYYPPLTSWDILSDSLISDPPSIHLIGISDMGGEPNPPINTNGQRANLWALRIFIDSNSHPQIIEINSVGLIGFGNNTAFVPGYIYYGVPSDANNLSATPEMFSLSQNYPNPFNSSTEIEFSLPQRGPVSLVIYDIQGREIRRLLDGNFEAGSHGIIWNGINDSNTLVSSGIYFYRLNSSNATQTNRMTLLR
jgi:hypothetical protein